MNEIKKLETKVNRNGDTQVLISKNDLFEKWVEVKEERAGKEVTLHFNSKFGGTLKHQSITLSEEDLRGLVAAIDSL